MVETAPSRISPTPSGRSGITPGLAAGGGPPQPLPQGLRPGRRSRVATAVAAGAGGWASAPARAGRRWGWRGLAGRLGACRGGPLAGGRLLLGPLRAGSCGSVPGCCAGSGRSAGSAGPDAPGSCPSDGADPGEAQPGVSFIVAPSRCPSAVAAAGWQPSCHGAARGADRARYGAAHLQLSAGTRGRLAAWLISTRDPARTGRPTRRSRRSAGRSHPKAPYWSCSTRRGCRPRRSSWSARTRRRWWRRSVRSPCAGRRCWDRRGVRRRARRRARVRRGGGR